MAADDRFTLVDFQCASERFRTGTFTGYDVLVMRSFVGDDAATVMVTKAYDLPTPSRHDATPPRARPAPAPSARLSEKSMETIAGAVATCIKQAMQPRDERIKALEQELAATKDRLLLLEASRAVSPV